MGHVIIAGIVSVHIQTQWMLIGSFCAIKFFFFELGKKLYLCTIFDRKRNVKKHIAAQMCFPNVSQNLRKQLIISISLILGRSTKGTARNGCLFFVTPCSKRQNYAEMPPCPRIKLHFMSLTF